MVRNRKIKLLETAIGALINYLDTADPKHFQPMNINWGLFPPLSEKKKLPKKEKYHKLAQRALKSLTEWIKKEKIFIE